MLVFTTVELKLQFGHKCSDRCGHGCGDFWKNSDRSPIFVQFIDCVFQLLVCFPDEFQYNEEFLFAILDNVSTILIRTYY